MDGLELAQKAAELTKEKLEINFTSPYPQAHYETVFDEKKASEENCIGEKVFIYHGHGFLFLNFRELSLSNDVRSVWKKPALRALPLDSKFCF